MTLLELLGYKALGFIGTLDSNSLFKKTKFIEW